jgi:hypothetical protein
MASSSRKNTKFKHFRTNIFEQEGNEIEIGGYYMIGRIVIYTGPLILLKKEIIKLLGM